MSENQYSRMAEFLQFGYFGYTSDEIAAMCPYCRIRMCAERAYLDWNRTIEYEKNASEKDKESFKTNGCTILIQGITGILDHKELYGAWSENNQKEFNDLHSGICKAIENYSNDQMIDSIPNTYLLKQRGEKRFYYGQAQKWLNMTIKYMVLLDISNICEIRELLHVPIDRYILRSAASTNQSRYKSKHSLLMAIAPKRHTGEEKSPDRIHFSDDAQPWSQLNQEDYIQLQQDLRDSIRKKNWEDIKCPMDWEARAWIEQAQLERK